MWGSIAPKRSYQEHLYLDHKLCLKGALFWHNGEFVFVFFATTSMMQGNRPKQPCVVGLHDTMSGVVPVALLFFFFTCAASRHE